MTKILTKFAITPIMHTVIEIDTLPKLAENKFLSFTLLL